MTPQKKKKLLLLAGALLLLTGGALTWRSGSVVAVSRVRPSASRVVVSAAARVAAERVVSEVDTASGTEQKLTRGEAARWVRALYRQEQLTRELALEQRRYGRNYWESPRDGSVVSSLQREREAMLRQLSAEANDVLNEFFPDETGEPVVLTAFFDADHAGPNVAFLSPAARARFEAEILASDEGRGVEPERLSAIAEHVLAVSEIETYRRWNDPSAVALRAQLVGFDATEREFAAILRDRRLSAEDGEACEATTLADTLGATRFAALQKLNEPALHAALSDLQRLGLPLAQAEWLAATRARAVADIGEIWRSAALTDAAKRAQVSQVERFYGQAIAAQLGLPEATLDGLAPGS